MVDGVMGVLPHVLCSLMRVFAGLSAGFALGTSSALVLSWYPRMDWWVSRLVYLTYPFPKVVLVPLLFVWLGIGEMSKIALIGIIVFYQVFVTTHDLIRQVDPRLILSVESLGASPAQLMLHVTIPYCRPGWFTCLRLCLGTSLAVLFFAETYATPYGIGFYIWDAFSRFDYHDVYFGSGVFCIVGFSLYRGLEALEAWVLR